MLKIKRPAIIGLLLILLIFTGYLNYQFTQQALRKTSQEYQNYEISEMENHSVNSEFVLDDDNIEIVDSIIDSENNVQQVISSSKETIDEDMDIEVGNLDRDY